MFVVGGPAHRTVESLSLDNWQWNILDPYPNIINIHSAKILTYNSHFYVFGGVSNELITKNILSYKNESWSKVGTMLSKRVKFSVILMPEIDGHVVHVIGGQENHKNELCAISSIVDCEIDSNIDFLGLAEPVLFGVNKNGSCSLTTPNYENKEAKELSILSNATFKEIDNFVKVQKTHYRINEQLLS